MKKIEKIEFQLLAPPEGNSAILEVCDQTGLDFLHVTATSKDDYAFRFFVGDAEFVLTLSQFNNIIEAAKSIEYVEYGDEQPQI